MVGEDFEELRVVTVNGCKGLEVGRPGRLGGKCDGGGCEGKDGVVSWRCWRRGRRGGRVDGGREVMLEGAFRNGESGNGEV